MIEPGDYVFAPDGPGRFVPSELGHGPWDPRALHGGAPAALIAAAFEAHEAGAGLPIARLTYEFPRPVPLAPLRLDTEVVRAGRRVVELRAELRADDTVVCTARALRAAAATTRRPPDGGSPAVAEAAPPGPEAGRSIAFGIDGAAPVGFASAMDMRWLDGELRPGPSTVWMRLVPALVAGTETTPLARLVAAADFGNGVGSALPWGAFLFINADLSIHLMRPPVGEWICLRAATHLDGGPGVAESSLFDRQGFVGRSLQTLIVDSLEG